MAKSYSIGTDDNGDYIICDDCGSKSYNPEDIRNKYCVTCNKFHTDDGKGFYLLPCRPDVCQECAVDHPPEFPHNRQSLYYQYKFYAKHNRWPTWEDAMEHCTPEMQEFWKDALRERGENV